MKLGPKALPLTLLVTALLLGVPTAQADNVINPGLVFVQSLAGQPMQLNLPPGFFGAGSDAFSAQVTFDGMPFSPQPTGASNLILLPFTTSFMSGTLQTVSAEMGDADTILRHGAGLLPPPGGSVTIPIEIVALSLLSSYPISVSWNGGASTTIWDIAIGLAPGQQPLGAMVIFPTSALGGQFIFQLPINPEFIFTQIGGAQGGPDSGPPNYPDPIVWHPGQIVLTGSNTYAVPEPASLALLGLGIVGLAAIRRRRIS